MELLQAISKSLLEVKAKSPLVHHITNYVTVNDCANMVLAIGASPVMADDIAEVEEMAGIASALVLNIGTLNSRTIESMVAAGRVAAERGIPIILDPVGVGATRLRTETAQRLLREVRPTVLRGNMSEIKVLAGLQVAIKGVDSVADEQGGVDVAKLLARDLNCVVAITGKTDIISDGTRTCLIDNGVRMLADITGTGCMTTSLVGSYCGATEDSFVAAAAGVMSMGLAGEIAYCQTESGNGIGTYRVKLFDSIYKLTPEALLQGGRITVE